MTTTATESSGERVLTPEILALAAVVVLGTIMTILDATIVNVALATLGREFGAALPTIQWVATAYLLAFASVIPLTGWTAERFGAKRVWLGSLSAFVVGSLLSGLSWSVASLIAFRVVQGLGAGMILPLGQTMLAQAAGPQRMGRVMSLIGVPMLLAPIFGPVIGGALVDAAGWRWIFFVNLPVGALALGLAVRLLLRPRGGRLTGPDRRRGAPRRARHGHRARRPLRPARLADGGPADRRPPVRTPRLCDGGGRELPHRDGAVRNADPAPALFPARAR
jgi:MFS family permease